MPLAPLLGRLGPLLGRAAPAARAAPGAGGLFGRLANGLGGVAEVLNFGNGVAQNLAPQVSTVVNVTVSGAPGCDYRQCYRLALSVAFGCLAARKNAGLGLLPPASTLTAHFIPTERFLGLQVTYSCSALENLIDAGAGRLKADGLAKVLPVFVGMGDEIKGGEFSQLSLLERKLLGEVPQLEGANKVLLTTKPTLPAPAPGGDRVGRGFLEGIVARSLLEPEHLVAHGEITEDDPARRAPGSPGAYSPLSGGRIPTPKQNAPVPFWSKFWFDRNHPTPAGVI